MESSLWSAPAAPGPLAAVADLPGSKSLTNRALVLAALSSTPTRITGGLIARDTTLMSSALTALGVRIEDDVDATLVAAGPMHGADIDCGLAGTVMRFLPPVAALATGTSTFDGDPHARTRPMHTVLDSLRQVGVGIDNDRLPFTVHGTGSVTGGMVTGDFSASSQFVSGLLLAGARFDKGIEITHIGKPVPSLPHIAMTCQALRAAGVTVDDSTPDRWLVSPGEIDAADIDIEPDLSNAAPFLAAAMLCGGSVRVPRWPYVSTQAGAELHTILAGMGAEVVLSDAGLSVTGTIAPLVADLHEVGELTPVLAALCAFADGESRLSGVGHIRGHETDRLASIAAELTALGGDVTETDDGLIIRPAQLRAGTWHCYADHRMAQAGAVVGLRVDGLTIDDIACTSKTMADFPGLWSAVLTQVN
jgi:3-phosphoshikimate 1-carboxyvinyltransferase